MSIIEGNLTVTSYGKRYTIVGFTVEDIRRMQILARRVYKLKTKKKRILKKYVSKLLNDSLKTYIKNMRGLSET